MSRIIDVKEKLKSIRLHTGREQAVFALGKDTGELLNIHRALIDKVFSGGGNIKYLLYSPAYSSETTPFKAKSLPGSSSLLATDDKFIITKNYHSYRKYPQIYVIDFSDILTLELGRAALMGWFRIEFVCKGAKEEVSVIFAASSGMFHFSSLIKVYTGRLNRLYPSSDTRRTYRTNELLNFLMDSVLLLLKIDKFSVWEDRKNILGFNRKKMISAACMIFAEKRGIVIVEERKNRLLPESNALFIPYVNIRRYRNKIYKDNALVFVLDLADTGYLYEIVFDRDRQIGEAMRLARVLQERMDCFKGSATLKLKSIEA